MLHRKDIIPTKYDAITSLVGGPIRWTEDSDVVEYLSGQTPPTEEAIQSKLAELQAAYDAQAYSRARESEYPSLQDCIHAILDNDLDALQLKRQAVKAKYPKP